MAAKVEIDIRHLLDASREPVNGHTPSLRAIVTATGLGSRHGEEICLSQARYADGKTEFLNWTLAERGDVVPTAWDRGAYTTGGLFRSGTPGGGRTTGRTFGNLARIVYLAADADLHAFLGLTTAEEKQRLYDAPQAQIDEAIEFQWDLVRRAYERTGYPIHELTYTGHGLLVKTFLHPEDQQRLSTIKALNAYMVDELNAAVGLEGRKLIDEQSADAGTRLHRVDWSWNAKPNGAPRLVRTLIPWDGASVIRVPADARTAATLSPSGRYQGADSTGEPATTHPLPDPDRLLLTGLAAGIWNETGARHTSALHLAGLLRKQRVPRAQAERIVRDICALAGDEELSDRLKAVATTYDAPEGTIAGYTKLSALWKHLPRGSQALAAISDLLDANWDAALHRATGMEPDSAGAPAGQIAWAYMSDVPEKQVDWIWPGWLAERKFHLVAGVQGDGKSTLVNAITAVLSSGAPLPDGATVPVRTIGYLVSEDGVEDTAIPRLRIHGADLDRHVWLRGFRTGEDEQPLSLAAHLPYLEDFITEHTLDVLVIDAVTDFMGSVKQNDNGEVRSVLRPLVRLADRTGCALIGIAHLGKSGGGVRRAIERVLGSGAFTQVPRVVWAVSTDPEDDEKRYLGQIKNNIGKEPPTLAWHRDLDRPISWDGVAETSVRAVMTGLTAKRPSRLEAARELLRRLLANGPQPSREVEAAATEAGIGKSTLREAQAELGVISEKEKSFEGRWLLRLP